MIYRGAMAPRSSVSRYRDYWADERRAARMYRALADLTHGERAEALRELAAIEDRHAAHWASLLEAAGEPLPPEPDLASDEADVLARARAR